LLPVSILCPSCSLDVFMVLVVRVMVGVPGPLTLFPVKVWWFSCEGGATSRALFSTLRTYVAPSGARKPARTACTRGDWKCHANVLAWLHPVIACISLRANQTNTRLKRNEINQTRTGVQVGGGTHPGIVPGGRGATRGRGQDAGRGGCRHRGRRRLGSRRFEKVSGWGHLRE